MHKQQQAMISGATSRDDMARYLTVMSKLAAIIGGRAWLVYKVGDMVSVTNGNNDKRQD